MAEIIGVRFKEVGKIYYFDPNGGSYRVGEPVVVETSRGTECGTVAISNREVDQTRVVKPLKKVTRPATQEDLRRVEENHKKEEKAFRIAQEKIALCKLEMKLVEVEYAFDGSKILFYFTADGRVDFRELVKELAGVFRTRIELRQIGVRDEAKMLGGLGICGRPFCCASFLGEFQPVSIKMAKEQGLSLNPTKISGACGRLMCCLKYEQDAYEDAIKRMPKNDSFVLTPDGPGNVSDVNLLKETVNVRLDDRPENARCYHNCEVCVLRSGKGSRDGIVIPDRRPERYVEPEREDDMPSISFISDFTPAPAAKSDEGEKRRRRSRGGRDRKRPEVAAPEKRGEKPVKADRPAKPEKTAMPEKPDKPGAGDKPRQGGSNRRRRSRGGSGAGGGAPQQQAAPRTPKPRQEGQSAPGGSGEQKRRPRHRGGRRRGGNPGQNTEA